MTPPVFEILNTSNLIKIKPLPYNGDTVMHLFFNINYKRILLKHTFPVLPRSSAIP